MTKKARIINQLNVLSGTEKETVIAFFNKHPVYENFEYKGSTRRNK